MSEAFYLLRFTVFAPLWLLLAIIKYCSKTKRRWLRFTVGLPLLLVVIAWAIANYGYGLLFLPTGEILYFSLAWLIVQAIIGGFLSQRSIKRFMGWLMTVCQQSMATPTAQKATPPPAPSAAEPPAVLTEQKQEFLASVATKGVANAISAVNTAQAVPERLQRFMKPV